MCIFKIYLKHFYPSLSPQTQGSMYSVVVIVAFCFSGVKLRDDPEISHMILESPIYTHKETLMGIVALHAATALPH